MQAHIIGLHLDVDRKHKSQKYRKYDQDALNRAVASPKRQINVHKEVVVNHEHVHEVSEIQPIVQREVKKQIVQPVVERTHEKIVRDDIHVDVVMPPEHVEVVDGQQVQVSQERTLGVDGRTVIKETRIKEPIVKENIITEVVVEVERVVMPNPALAPTAETSATPEID